MRVVRGSVSFHFVFIFLPRSLVALLSVPAGRWWRPPGRVRPQGRTLRAGLRRLPGWGRRAGASSPSASRLETQTPALGAALSVSFSGAAGLLAGALRWVVRGQRCGGVFRSRSYTFAPHLGDQEERGGTRFLDKFLG